MDELAQYRNRLFATSRMHVLYTSHQGVAHTSLQSFRVLLNYPLSEVVVDNGIATHITIPTNSGLWLGRPRARDTIIEKLCTQTVAAVKYKSEGQHDWLF